MLAPSHAALAIAAASPRILAASSSSSAREAAPEEEQQPQTSVRLPGKKGSLTGRSSVDGQSRSARPPQHPGSLRSERKASDREPGHSSSRRNGSNNHDKHGATTRSSASESCARAGETGRDSILGDVSGVSTARVQATLRALESEKDELFQRLKAVELELQRTEMAEKQAKAAAQQRKKLSRLERLAKPRAHATTSSSSPAASSPFR